MLTGIHIHAYICSNIFMLTKTHTHTHTHVCIPYKHTYMNTHVHVHTPRALTSQKCAVSEYKRYKQHLLLYLWLLKTNYTRCTGNDKRRMIRCYCIPWHSCLSVMSACSWQLLHLNSTGKSVQATVLCMCVCSEWVCICVWVCVCVFTCVFVGGVWVQIHLRKSHC